MYPLGKEDSTEAALAQLFDNLVLIQVIIVVLVIEDILPLETQTGPPERRGGRFRFEESTTHGAAVALINRRQPISGRTSIEAAGCAAHLLVSYFHPLQDGLLLRVEIAIVSGRGLGGIPGW